jgi:hypothetical protein
MRGFRQMHTLQKFASVHTSLHNHFNLDRHLINSSDATASVSLSTSL